jgi:hypothetical protein
MKNLKTYIKLVLEEKEINSKEENQEALVADLLDMFENKIKKERFKAVGKSLLKIGTASVVDVVEGISSVSDLFDGSDAIKDQAVDLIKKSTSKLGLNRFIARFAEKKQSTNSNNMLNIDPDFSKIIDNKVEKEFIEFYTAKLKENKGKTIKQFTEEFGDITSAFTTWLELNKNGITVEKPN